MNLVHFQQLSKRTMPFGGEPGNKEEFEKLLGNYAMGLVGEALEMSSAMNKQNMYYEMKDHDKAMLWAENSLLEAGDTLHYAVGLLSCLGETLDLSKVVEGKKGGLLIAGDICEIAKKHIYHLHELDREGLITKVYEYIGELDRDFDAYMDGILNMNIQKLMKRYPEKFNAADSIARVDLQGNEEHK